jgi:transcriptional/translational regulatory protein YebC/TACO1
MASALTDNRNRTGGEVRKLFEKYGGALGSTGCVAWQFETKAFLTVSTEGHQEDDVMMAALEGGAEEVTPSGENFEITGPPTALDAIRTALQAAGIEIESAEVTNLASTMVALGPHDGVKAFSLLQALDDHDDINSTDTNLEVTDELLAAVEAEE